MAEATQSNNKTDKTKRTNPSKGQKRPVYIGLKVRDGATLPLSKSDLEVVFTTRDTRVVVEKLEANPGLINIKTDI